jgi:hypothetical protein
MSERTIALLDRLVESFPPLKPLFEERLADNFGEVLPHLLVADITRYIIDMSRDPVSDKEVRSLLGVLESEFATGDEDVQELLAVSFLENLPESPQVGYELRKSLGPALSAELARMDSR